MSRFDRSKGLNLWGSGFVGSSEQDIGAHIKFGFDNFYQCEVELVGSKGRTYTDLIFTALPTHASKVDIYKSGARKQSIEIEPSNHYENLLVNFKEKALTGLGLVEEYQQNY
jgi:NDP-hexose-3-ketoreductase